MKPARPKDFEREIPKIAAVANARRAPEQLSLDELVPQRVHGWGETIALEYGYVKTCKCGWRSREVESRSDAHRELRRHLGRTPQGSVLVRTLRRYGRGGSGA